MNITDLEALSPGQSFYDVNDQLKHHVYARSRRAFVKGDAARDAVITREDLETRQRQLREDFIALLGGLPSTDTPLAAKTVGFVEGDGFRIEKVVYQSRPHHYVTSLLYLPDGLQAPRGAALFLCGHWPDGKHARQYQEVCQTLVHAGLIVLAQDPIGQGERGSYYEPELGDFTVAMGTREHDHAGAQCLPLGDGLARYFLHDAIRSVDYLCTRREVDPDRIGVTGNSGGGTQTSMVMLAEPRIAAAAPATFIMNRESYLAAGGAQDAEQIWPGFTGAGYDHEDILLAMAPRPVRVLAVTGDFFPIEGTRRTVERCRRFWRLCGREDAFDKVEDASAHSFTPRLAEAAAEFFARHLLDRESVEIDQGRIHAFPQEQVCCTKSGQVRAEFPDAESVFEVNRTRLQELETGRLSLAKEERLERARAWLRERVERDRTPCELNPRFYHTAQCEEMAVEAAIWRSQEDVFGHGILLRDSRFHGKPLPVTVAIWDGGTNVLHPHLPWIRQTCEHGRAVLVLDVSGVGGLTPRAWTSAKPAELYGAIHKLADDLIWLGDDLVSLRVWDVLRSLDMIAEWSGLDSEDIRVHISGKHGLYGRAAALLDSRIRRVDYDGKPFSIAEWIASRHYDTDDIYSIVMPGLLRYFDARD